jgi:Rps23 Pro-64 3,4-dihydroxylase Tpa1-like proline 4-hydroxylase
MMHNEVIKVVKNFMTEEEMKFWRDYNDEILETKKEYIAYYEEGRRPILQFGNDKCWSHNSYPTLEIVKDQEDKIRSVFDRVTDATKKAFDDDEDLYMSSFWFAKQLPGSEVREHEDTDSGKNTQFKYSAVFYLNTLKMTGQLIFSDLHHSIKPDAGDLVIFKSQDTGRHLVEPIDEDRYTIAMWMTGDTEYAL